MSPDDLRPLPAAPPAVGFKSPEASGGQAILWVWLSFALLMAVSAINYGPMLPLPNGKMGHDYSLTLTTWLDGYLWFRNNGLAVPWFTPSFCAGQPFYPDPQSSYYSLSQFLYFALGPATTPYVTLMLHLALMFWGGYMLMRRAFHTSATVAALVGAALMLNDFLPLRVVIGHLGFVGIALVPWIALCLLIEVSSRRYAVLATLISGMLMAYWVHSGFGTMMLPAGLAIALIVLLRCLSGGRIRHAVFRALPAIAIALALSASKLSAAFAFLSHFPRTSYLLPGATSVFDALVLLSASLTLPSEWVETLGRSRMTNQQWALSPHEWAFSFGLGLAALLLVTLALRAPAALRAFRSSPRALLLGALFLGGMAWPLAFNTWGPDWNAFLKTLPILNSTSTPTRWIVVYVPVLAVLLGLALQRSNWTPRTQLIAAACAIGLSCAQGLAEPRTYYRAQDYDPQALLLADQAIRAGQLKPEIRELGTVAALQIGDLILDLRLNDTFLAGVSQVFCYNPIFGYRLERFDASNLRPGEVLNEENGLLNLKNPACYVFPEANMCGAGDVFSASQAEQALAFSRYQPYNFKTSDRQQIAARISWTSVCGILIAMALLIVLTVRSVATNKVRL